MEKKEELPMEQIVSHLAGLVLFDGKHLPNEDLVYIISNWDPWTELSNDEIDDDSTALALDCYYISYVVSLQDYLWEYGSFATVTFAKNNDSAKRLTSLVQIISTSVTNFSNEELELLRSMMLLIYHIIKCSLLDKLDIHSKDLVRHLVATLRSLSDGDTILGTLLFLTILELAESGIYPRDLKRLQDYCSGIIELEDMFQGLFNLDRQMDTSVLFYEKGHELSFNELSISDKRSSFLIDFWVNVRPSSNVKCDNRDGSEVRLASLLSNTGSLLMKYSIENARIKLQTYTEELYFSALQLNYSTVNHISLVHVNEGRKLTRIDLYAAGKFVESKVFQPLFIDPYQPQKGFFGYRRYARDSTNFKFQLFGPSDENYMLLEISSIKIIETAFYQEWILLLQKLGATFCGNFIGTDFLSTLTSSQMADLSYEVQSIGKVGIGKLSLENGYDSVMCSWTASNPWKYYVKYTNLESKEKEVSTFLAPTKVTTSIFDTFDALGAHTECLKYIETADSENDLLRHLRFLLFMVENSKSFENVFIAQNGFDVLSVLLKARKNLITMEILDVLLEFVGFHPLCPEESIIRNRLAYKVLLLDFRLWQCSSETSTLEMRRFLLYQFTVFMKESKHAKHNQLCLADMAIIKRILMALKRGEFAIELHAAIQNVLWVLLRGDPKPELFKLLVLHVIFTIEKIKETSGNECKVYGGEATLDLLLKLTREHRKLLNLLSFKFLLVTLEGSLEMRRIGVTLIIDVITTSTQAYNKFLLMGGFSIMSNLLQRDWSDTSMIGKLLISVFKSDSTKEYEYTLDVLSKSFNETPTSEIRNKHLFGVLSNIMIFPAKSLNTTDVEKAMVSLNIYVDMLLNLKRNKAFYVCFLENEDWIANIVFITMIIKRSNNGSISSRYEAFLNDILIDTLYSSSGTNDFKLIEALCTTHPIESCEVLVPLLLLKLKAFPALANILFSDKAKAISICKITLCYFQTCNKVALNEADFLSCAWSSPIIVDTLNRSFKAQPKVLQYTAILEVELTKFICKQIFQIIGPTESIHGDIVTPLSGYCQLVLANATLIAKASETADFTLLLVILFRLSCREEYMTLSIGLIRSLLIARKDCDDVAQMLQLSDVAKNSLKSIFESSLHSTDEALVGLYKRSEILKADFDKYYESCSKAYAKSHKVSVEQYVEQKLSMERSRKLLERDLYPFSKMIYQAESNSLNAYIQDEIDDFYYYLDVLNTVKANCLDTDMELQSTLYSTEGKDRKRNKIITKIVDFHDDDATSKLTNNSNSAQLSQRQHTDDLTSMENNADYVTVLLDPEVPGNIEEDRNRRVLRNLFVHDRIAEIHNVTQVVGLEAIEAILVHGSSHVYIIAGYFINKNGEICSCDDNIDDERDQIVKLLKDATKPKNEDSSQMKHSGSLKHFRVHSTKSWSLASLVSVSKRTFLLRDVAIELFFDDGSSILFTCLTSAKRNKIVDKLRCARTTCLANKNLEEALKLSSQQNIKITKADDRMLGGNFNIVDSFLSTTADMASSYITFKWCNGMISNFQYLMLLNTVAGRTFNDLTQYPVFPFVLADYDSKYLNLEDPNVYRDLSKPMGVQSAERADQFRYRFEATKEMSPDTPPFHYGTHYSSAMIVVSYLIRLQPFTESFLRLQGGKFDHPDRLFHSISKVWNSASKENTTDVRELIPEFYYLPEFMRNMNHFDFGKLQDGSVVDDVELPPWAEGDYYQFIRVMRDALESDYVSEHLPEWIDLIFGYKQQGEEAIRAVNVFHYLSYPGSVDLDRIENEHERAVAVSIIHNFGQTPLQIFKRKHPSKICPSSAVYKDIREMYLNCFKNRVYKVDCEVRKIKHIKQHVRPDNAQTGFSTLIHDAANDRWYLSNHDNSVHYGSNGIKLQVELLGQNSVVVNNKYVFEQLSAGGRITFLKTIDSTSVLLGFDFGAIKLYEVTTDKYKHVTNAQRSIVKLSENIAVGERYQRHGRKKVDESALRGKIIWGFKAGEKSSFSLVELSQFMNGHEHEIVKMEYIKDDGIIVSLDTRGAWITIWHKHGKSGFQSGEVLKISQLTLSGLSDVRDDEAIVDFDISVDNGFIIGVTNFNRVVIWRYHGLLVLNRLLPIDGCHMIRCYQNFTENDYVKGLLLVVGHEHSQYKVCYVSREAKDVDIISELDLEEASNGKAIEDLRLLGREKCIEVVVASGDGNITIMR